MPRISVDTKREIVEDFASVIDEKKTRGPKPAASVINFRNEKRDQVERSVCLLPTTLLRYRKDNGRIASNVINYEKRNGPLDERDAGAQEILAKFLAEKDPGMVQTLSDSLAHIGQNEPAIITCDGFLINGNRRKMVLERLAKTPGVSKFMKVVILPRTG